MKRVVIVRHAKSVPYGYEDDFNRNLQDRGENDAKLVSRELNKLGIKPGIIISSPAKRALKTARIFAENLGYEKTRIREEHDIYDGLTTTEFLRFIHSLPEDADTVFFFGHNPGFHHFVHNLLKEYNLDMPTCATIGIDFHVDRWQKVKARTGEMAFRLTPKML